MLFSHDTECALGGLAALVNTTDGASELLPDLAALETFLTVWSWSGPRQRSEPELRAVRALRPRLRRFWELDEDGVVVLTNELLREGQALPQLVKHDEWDYHIHAAPMNAPIVVRMAVESAMAMVDVIRTKELSRLRMCEYPDCTNVVIDLTKNRSKRFCDAGCGNRAAVNAYRARLAERAAQTASRGRSSTKQRARAR